jgi:NADH-quinone oxidoreductase subunit H
MASYPQDVRFGGFVGSLIWLIFWILVIVALVGLPLIFIILFYVPLPEIDGKVLTPYLFLTSILYPQSAIPVVNTLLASTFFKVAVFPGFTYAALIAAATIFIERKFLAKMQLRVGPLYAGKIEGILQADLLGGTYSVCRNCCRSCGSYTGRPWMGGSRH